MSDEEQVFERGMPIQVIFVPRVPHGPLNVGECGWYNSRKAATLSTARIRRKNPLEMRNKVAITYTAWRYREWGVER